MAVRGDPTSSKNIFNSMRSLSGKGPLPATQKPPVAGNINEQRVSMPSLLPNYGGGAAASLARKKVGESVVEEPFVSVEKRRINIGSYEEDIVESLRLGFLKNDYLRVLESLLKLYAIGKLGEYEISGVKKDDVFKLLDDFEEVLDSVITE